MKINLNRGRGSYAVNVNGAFAFFRDFVAGGQMCPAARMSTEFLHAVLPAGVPCIVRMCQASQG